MKRILVTGSNGQIGAELIPHLRKLYGAENVLATDLQPKPLTAASEGGPYQTLDVLDRNIGHRLYRHRRASPDKKGTGAHLPGFFPGDHGEPPVYYSQLCGR